LFDGFFAEGSKFSVHFKHSYFGVLIFFEWIYGASKRLFEASCFAVLCLIPLPLLSDGWRVQAHSDDSTGQIGVSLAPQPQQPKQQKKNKNDNSRG
jgi:hypothetical protein